MAQRQSGKRRRYSAEDREDKLGDTIAGYVATKVDHVKPDVLLLEAFADVEGVDGTPKEAVKLGSDDRVAGSHTGEHR